MVPPCFSMMPRLTQRPRPVPCSPLVVKKGSKMWSRASGSMPVPVSAIWMTMPGRTSSGCGEELAGA